MAFASSSLVANWSEGVQPPAPHTPVLIASLLVTLLMGGWTLLRHWTPMRRLQALGGDWGRALVPRLFAFFTFLAGAILLFSGATPARSGRLGWLNDLLPVPIIEVSAYFSSIAGIGLIILSRGLQRRLDAAYHLTVWLLVGGVVFELASALDVEQAVVLTVMLIGLLVNRRYFDRRASVFDEPFSWRWFVSVGVVFAGTIALAIWGYGKDALSTQMFWQFATNAQAPRAIRALTLAAIAGMAFGVARLLRPARARVAGPSAADLDAISPIVRLSPRAATNLVYLGDKSLMLNGAKSAFIMYSIAGRSWVSLGDPVGDPSASIALIEAFMREADQHGGWPVFYRAGPELLYLYLDYGFTAVKLGEFARVPLGDFSLEGPHRRNLRRVWRKMKDDGCTVDVLAPDQVTPLLGKLRGVSNEWLAAKRAREKRFSLGRFDDSFVMRFPTAVVRQNDRIIAFGTGWPAGQKAEIEIDLMRHTNDAPSGIMRYLIIEFMFWAKAQGFQAFNLGMAPLSGLRPSTFQPLWVQLSAAVRELGEPFYNFRGIREFKEWFYPEWEPSYLVSPGGRRRPIIAANIASLVSGGMTGILTR